MTLEEKVVMLKTMMDGDAPDDAILIAYLKMARQKVLNRMYPFKEDFTDMDVPEKYESVQLRVANYWISKIGAEGQIQHIENGVHRNYGASDVPDELMNEVVPFAHVIR